MNRINLMWAAILGTVEPVGATRRDSEVAADRYVSEHVGIFSPWTFTHCSAGCWFQYRVDSGHPVHQVSDAAKAEVSQQAKEAARRINRKAFEDRLREIEMSEEEHNSYVGFVQPIQSEIAALKSTLDMTKHRGDERAWLKGQLDGELDTSRLVEGVAGEKHVFKRRAKLPEHRGSKKTYIRFVFDCSASMYRFGGYDQRLVRSLQAAALVMEAFDGASDQFVYSMVGHSGDSKRIELSDFGRPPANPKERMVLLQTMAAHAQFSDSGDNTLAAIRCAVDDVSKCDGNTIVIVISDANFDRYGIRAQDLKNAMKGPAKTFCIFIAGFGDEATKIQQSIPPGKVSVCRDTSELPKTFRDILTGEIDHSW
jgi:von Willebrand factor A domain-containing protein 8